MFVCLYQICIANRLAAPFDTATKNTGHQNSDPEPAASGPLASTRPHMLVASVKPFWPDSKPPPLAPGSPRRMDMARHCGHVASRRLYLSRGSSEMGHKT